MPVSCPDGKREAFKVASAKFRRQQPIGRFIVDFCAPSLRLIIEIDGIVHLDQQDDDRERQHLIERLGFRFLQIPAEAVERDLPGTITLIEQVVRELEAPSPPTPLPSPRGHPGEGSKTNTRAHSLPTLPPSPHAQRVGEGARG